MFSRQITAPVVFICILISCLSVSAADKPSALDRSLEKVASAMMRAYPELKGGKRTKEARTHLLREFRSLDADDLSAEAQKKLRRRKADFKGAQWVELVRRFEQANLTDPRCVFLLKEAKDQKMTSTQQYIFMQLMKGYLEKELKSREELSRSRLRRVGKEYSAFLKAEKREPESLEEFVSDDSLMYGLQPQTGLKKRWVYVGAGPVAMRGGNRFRVVAYSPFSVGRGEQFCWVAYKGGSLGEWKRNTILSKHDKMKRDCALFYENQAKKKREKSLAKLKKDTEKQAAEKKTKLPKKLKITIRELW